MIANKNRKSLLFYLGLAYSLGSFSISLQGMGGTPYVKPTVRDYFSTAYSYLTPTTLISLLETSTCACEILSDQYQDILFRKVTKKEDDDKIIYEKVSESIIKLIKEVLRENEFKHIPKITITRMKNDVTETIAKTYHFMGIMPTDKVLYIDEEYLNFQSKENQKVIIRTALSHYLNNTYVVTRTAHTATTTMALIGAAKVSENIHSLAKNVFDEYIYPSDNESGVFKYIKTAGIYTATAIIGMYVASKAYSKASGIISGLCNSITDKYLTNKNREFIKSALQNTPNDDKKKLAKKARAGNAGTVDTILNQSLEAVLDQKILDDAKNETDSALAKAKKEFDAAKKSNNQQNINAFINTFEKKAVDEYFNAQELKNYIVDSIMADIRNEFEKEKAKGNKFNVFTLRQNIGKIQAQYPESLGLSALVEDFTNNEIMPYQNRDITTSRSSSWSLLDKIWPWRR